MEETQALLDAAQTGDLVIVEELLRRGVAVDSVDAQGNTALHYAASSGHEQVVRCLVAAKASLDAQSQYGWTALMQAAANGHIPVINQLLKHSPDVNAVNQMGTTALGIAAHGGHTSALQALLAHGAQANGAADGMAPLAAAAQNGHESAVRLLLDNGAAVDIKNPDTMWTPLMVAAMNGHLTVVQVLVHNGADPNAQSIRNLTALDVAGLRGQSAVEKLLAKLTDTEGKASWRQTHRMDLFEASKRGETDVVLALLNREGVDPNKRDEDGATCLMFAAMRGHLEVAQLLVDRAVDIDAQDGKSGWTALMQATYYGQRAIARLLIDAGANVTLQANNGCTAFDIASIIADTEVVRLLAAVSMRAGSASRLRVADSSSPRRKPHSSRPSPTARPVPNKEEGLAALRPARRNSSADRNSKASAARKLLLDDVVHSDSGAASDARMDRLAEHMKDKEFPVEFSTSSRRASWWSRFAHRFQKLKRTPFTLVSSLSSQAIPSAFDDAATGDVCASPAVRLHAPASPRKSPSTAPRGTPPPLEWPLNGSHSSNQLSLGGRDASPRGRRPSLPASIPISQSAGGIPAHKLPADILAPIKPPFMPPPVFELSLMERPKLQRPPTKGLPERMGSSGSGVFPSPRRPNMANFLRPDRSGSSVKGLTLSPPMLHTRRVTSPALLSPSRSSDSGRPTRRLRVRKRRSASSESGTDYGSSMSDTSADEREDLGLLLARRGLSEYISVLEEQEIDLESFVTLSNSDLKELGVEAEEHRARLLGLIKDLNKRKVGQKSVDRAVQNFRLGRELAPPAGSPSLFHSWDSMKPERPGVLPAMVHVPQSIPKPRITRRRSTRS